MENLRDRNNTSFPKELNELLINLKQEINDPLQYHQRIAHDYLLKYPKIRGILGFQEMGSGKSILAVSVCESIMKTRPEMKILMIIAKSLHHNMKDNIKKYIRLCAERESENWTASKDKSKGSDKKDEEVEEVDNKSQYISDAEIEEHIKNNYQFISLNAGNMLKQVQQSQKPEDILVPIREIEDSEFIKFSQLGNLDNTMIVIDEAHNFFNSISHGSKNAIGLYRLIMNAKNIKLLFLSGSPIVNDPFEIAICYNMLAGKLTTHHMKTTRDPFARSKQEESDYLTLFGEDYSEFVRYFINNEQSFNLDSGKRGDEQPPDIKNAGKFVNRIIGLTSFYSTELGDIKHLFPQLLPAKIVKVPMSIKQYSLYSIARDKEIEETKRSIFREVKKPLQKPSGVSSSYRVRSRQISNFIYPDYASSISQDAKGVFHYNKDINLLREESFSSAELEVYSPKFLNMLKCIAKHIPNSMLTEIRKPGKVEIGKKDVEVKEKVETGKKDVEKGKVETGKNVEVKKVETGKNVEVKKVEPEKKIGKGPGLIYSQFLDSGIVLFGKVLEYYGFKEVKSNNDLFDTTSPLKKEEQGRYCIISGNVDPEIRAELIKSYNSPANKDGQLITILLFTATGAEGLDTMRVRWVMAMEPFWHWSRISQVFGRAVRLGSHMDLPEADRTVQPYLFLSDYPITVKKSGKGTGKDAEMSELEKENFEKFRITENTTDVTLYTKSINNQRLIDKFLQTMRESSIDCSIWSAQLAGKTEMNNRIKELKCKMCLPTDRPLFIDNLDKDMMTLDPCTPWTEEKVKVKSILLIDKNKEYKYALDKDDPDIIHVFQYNPVLKGYEEIFTSHPDFAEIISAIKQNNK